MITAKVQVLEELLLRNPKENINSCLLNQAITTLGHLSILKPLCLDLLVLRSSNRNKFSIF